MRKKTMISDETAEAAILEAMSDGKVWLPTDFEETFVGGTDPMWLLKLPRLAFNNSPWGQALGRLVDAKKVVVWRNEAREWLYQLAGSNQTDLHNSSFEGKVTTEVWSVES